MTAFDAQADQVVRTAVDAHLAGRTRPNLPAEAAFETRNSRYGVRNGVIVDAKDPTFVGCEVVGWLLEAPGGRKMAPLWQPGARAVLVDRRRDGEIVVTSGTRALLTPSGAPEAHAGSFGSQPPAALAGTKPPSFPSVRVAPPPRPRPMPIRPSTPVPGAAQPFAMTAPPVHPYVPEPAAVSRIEPEPPAPHAEPFALRAKAPALHPPLRPRSAPPPLPARSSPPSSGHPVTFRPGPPIARPVSAPPPPPISARPPLPPPPMPVPNFAPAAPVALPAPAPPPSVPFVLHRS